MRVIRSMPIAIRSVHRGPVEPFRRVCGQKPACPLWFEVVQMVPHLDRFHYAGRSLQANRLPLIEASGPQAHPSSPPSLPLPPP
jgi:hypothetical protein